MSTQTKQVFKLLMLKQGGKNGAPDNLKPQFTLKRKNLLSIGA
jgi:hypothetical protein